MVTQGFKDNFCHHPGKFLELSGYSKNLIVRYLLKSFMLRVLS